MTQNNLFVFPKTLINDIEGFIFYYKKKFPKMVDKYLDIMKRYCNDPDELRKLCMNESAEMIRISKKFVEFYKIDSIKNLRKLIEIDQKLNKLSCFKFWIYNYLLCEGPLHFFHVEKIKEISEKLAEGDNPEERDYEKERIEKMLIQTDYTDFYVENLIRSMKIRDELAKHPEFEIYVSKFENFKNTDYKKINDLVKELSDKIKLDKEKYKVLWEEFVPLLKICDIQGTNFPMTSVIRMGFEHKENAVRYQKEHKKLREEIEKIFVKAKKNLSHEDHQQLNTSYKMLKLLAECKDLFGESDTIILPFWFRLIKIIAEKMGKPELGLGQGSSYYNFVWNVPDHIKGMIYEIDNTDFNEEKLFK